MRKAKVWFSTPPQSFFMLGHSMATSRCSQEGKERKESRRIVQADVAIVGFVWDVGIVALQWPVVGNMVDFLVRLGRLLERFDDLLHLHFPRWDFLLGGRWLEAEPVHADRNRDGAREEDAQGEDGKRVWLVATARDPIHVDSKQPDNDRQEAASSNITDKLCVTRTLVEQFLNIWSLAPLRCVTKSWRISSRACNDHFILSTWLVSPHPPQHHRHQVFELLKLQIV